MNKNMMIGIVVLLVVMAGFWYMSANKSATTSDVAQEEAAVETMEGEEVGGNSMEIALAAVEGSDPTQTGTATITEVDGAVTVVVSVSPALDMPQPAHIHVGACPGVGEVKFPLTSLVDGTSTTTIETTLEELQAEELAINIHKSAEESKVYTACGGL